MATNRRSRTTSGRSGKGSRGKAKSAIKVDLTGVETRKNLPEGQYMVTLNSASVEKSQNSGNDYIKFEFEVSEGKFRGAKLYHNSSLQPQALFNLKAVLAALGFSIPNKAFELELEDLIGLTCIVEVTHEVYQGENRARITEFINADDEDDDEDDEDDDEDDEDYDEDDEDYDDEDDDEDDEDDEDDDEDYTEMSLSELKSECKSRGIKFSKDAKKKKLIALLEEDDEE